MSAEARTSVVQNRSGWTTDASRDDRCAPFRIGPRLSAGVMIIAVLPANEMLFDVVDVGFGRRTVRCEIAP